MTTTWNFAYLLPHVAFRNSIENGFLALVPYDDDRLKSLSKTQPAVKKLLTSFRDQFGEKINPSALLIRSDVHCSVDFYAVASFRNSVAISTIIDGWTFKLSGGTAGYPLWSDYCDFYPFSATRDGTELIGHSVANMELNQPTQFSGQRAAHLPSADRLSFGVDEYVLKGCLKNWERRFVKGRMEWKTRVLFRALEVACQASRLPAVGTQQPTIHDIGVGIALWISAFEIISHPRTGKVDRIKVLDLLGQADWSDSKLRSKRYSLKNRSGNVLMGNSGNPRKFNFIQKLYAELNRARNDFLHGNPVATGSLFPSKIAKGPTLLHYAPLIFRAALMNFLPIEPEKTSKKDLTAQLSECMTFHIAQDRYESAVEACRKLTLRRR